MRLTDADLFAWLQQYFWTFARIGGVFMSAPVLAGRTVPARVRLVMALVFTLILAPLTPKGAPLELFSAGWYLTLLQQLLIGIAIGFVLQLAFEAVTLGGEMIAYSMGLSFAQATDPVRNTQTPLPGQFLIMVASLLFLAGGGHLLLVELLAGSFQSMPVSSGGLETQQFADIAGFGSQIFSGGLRIALPAVIALLLVNLAFGVMSRASPALNIQSVGFPLSLMAGLWLLMLTLPNLQSVFAIILEHAVQFIRALVSGG